ncbi:UMP-CMP kinase [Pseudomassariella vexata]|uniref:Uridylate kinase n=1 Tax=Pseudomassariella vexata TaxID=1141098 RepID=A0A1Y2DSV5_9PEZI|nr:UMP-CMP kinase [Pseudomassariella vexata]ORY62337.1 UMP-CMP kinase [Pseudomassariella vexata]
MAAPTQRLLWRQLTRATSRSASRSASSPCLRLTSTSPASAFARTSKASSPPPEGSNVKFWPFVVIIVLGSLGYTFLVTRRAEMPAIDAPKKADALGAPPKSTPTFSADDVTVVFVLGGPGAGKGTQCANLVADYGFHHLSAGDLLRAEQDRPGSQFGDLIKDYIKNGLIVPMEVTVQLLENAMVAAIDSSGKGEIAGKKGKFLIDGFPRKMDQAHKFEESVCPAKFVLFYDCPEAEMERRLLNRGKTSGRTDDNAESIRKRFRTFIETSMPVVDYYEKLGRVIKVDATPKPEDVYKDTQKQIAGKGI